MFLKHQHYVVTAHYNPLHHLLPGNKDKWTHRWERLSLSIFPVVKNYQRGFNFYSSYDVVDTPLAACIVYNVLPFIPLALRAFFLCIRFLFLSDKCWCFVHVTYGNIVCVDFGRLSMWWRKKISKRTSVGARDGIGAKLFSGPWQKWLKQITTMFLGLM